MTQRFIQSIKHRGIFKKQLLATQSIKNESTIVGEDCTRTYHSSCSKQFQVALVT